MYRHTSRSLLRSLRSSSRAAQPAYRRFIGTSSPSQGRSWKSSAARWGVAVGGIYFYNTSPIFANGTPRYFELDSDQTREAADTLQTVDSYAAARKEQRSADVSGTPLATDGPAALEEEASEQGAFNPTTGEINWDCPCLGGMAHGPCGEEFRAAFSCFVYSEQEPKGLDCIERFKGMQDCFREHPDVYAAELDDDDPELEEELAKEREALQKDAASAQTDSQTPQKRLLDDPISASLPISPILSADAPPTKRERRQNPMPASRQEPKEATPTTQPATSSKPDSNTDSPNATERLTDTVSHQAQSDQIKGEKFDQDLELMPKPWHDSREVNDKVKKGDEKESSKK